VKGRGPCARVNTALRSFVAAEPQVACCVGSQFVSVRLWFARTGKFCVTTWPKLEPKHADIKPPAVTDPNHGLGIELIGETDARRKSLQCVVDIAV